MMKNVSKHTVRKKVKISCMYFKLYICILLYIMQLFFFFVKKTKQNKANKKTPPNVVFNLTKTFALKQK